MKYGKCLPLIMACMMFGCVSLPEQKGIWPWEYPMGKGEPNSGDYVAVRVGVANFGETPTAVKPVTPESVEQHTPDARSAPVASVTKTEPPAESNKGSARISSMKKDYDFKVSMSTSPPHKLLDIDTSGYDITAFNYGNAPVSVAVDVDQSSARNTSADKSLPHYAVVKANTERTLVHFSPKTKDAVPVRYSYIWSLGDYTASHNCPEHEGVK